MSNKFDVETKLFGANAIERITTCTDVAELQRYLSEAFGMLSFNSQVKLVSIITNVDVKEQSLANVKQMEGEIKKAGYKILSVDGCSFWDFNNGEEASCDYKDEQEAIIDAYTDMLVKAELALAE